MIEYSIPSFKTKINLELNKLLDNYPYKFNDDCKIVSVYDSFPCIWNGGRIKRGKIATKEEIIDNLNYWNNRGVSVIYTFTNLLLEKKHLSDEIGNFILDITAKNQKIKTGITVASDILEKHIRNKYSDQFYFLESTTLGIEDINLINEMTKSKTVIPSYTLNNKFDILNRINNKDQIELLIAEYCADNCPCRLIHYKSISRLQLSCKVIDGEFTPTANVTDIAKEFGEAHCPPPIEPEGVTADVLLSIRKHNITIDDIRTKYIPIGFNRFKISGRNLIDFSPNRIDRYCEYLVKPEYINEIRDILLERCKE